MSTGRKVYSQTFKVEAVRLLGLPGGNAKQVAGDLGVSVSSLRRWRQELQPGEGHPEAVSSERPFPIVGIGASAGGLEALDAFLANTPADSGMAFVIVQHLDPTHKGMMAQLLQRSTPMPVAQVTDRMVVAPNCVYVIPPNKDLSILHGVLHLLDPVAPRGLRLPIDFFLRALADDRQEQSIGVILSGMGSDGTLGLRAIKEKAGVAFVQDPISAKFNGMPHSAIEAGLADVVAPVEALPDKILAYLQHAPLIAKRSDLLAITSESTLEKVVILLRATTGHDFSLYKKSTLYRRIERRMGLHQIGKIADYVRYLQANSHEVKLLFNELLIGVTNFFRDPEAWAQVEAQVLPALLAQRRGKQALRAWIPACATGEEAYSLAILIREALEKLHPPQAITVQIFATDLDVLAIERARLGIYPANIAADVSPERLDRFFDSVDQGYRVAKSVREMVIFAPQNLIMDPPFTKLDFVSCRNLLIYLTAELQKKLIPLFHYSLNPGGFLLLGTSETVGSFTDIFHPLAGKMRLYQRLETVRPAHAVEFPTAFVTAQREPPASKAKAITNLQGLADQVLLQRYAPAAVLTTDSGDILYISGRTGKYLEPAAGAANWNIFVMARDGLRHGLFGGYQKALRQKETVNVAHLVVGTNGGRQAVNLTIQPFEDPSELAGMVMVVFADVEAVVLDADGAEAQSAPSPKLEIELEYARQESQSLREEMRTSQEELKSANEELQSTNEELQSTNEELTTSKEEMQSMNEELHTVNLELQIRLDELARINDDMKNLLDSTDIATIFLDNGLRVRRFTHETGKITQLLQGDVGRPITDIASALLYPELADDAREVLRTLIKAERQIATPDGEWFAVRILPYRTLDNRIDGVVVTFFDITITKKLEMQLRERNEARSVG